jgi:hypothetical protein
MPCTPSGLTAPLFELIFLSAFFGFVVVTVICRPPGEGCVPGGFAAWNAVQTSSST